MGDLLNKRHGFKLIPIATAANMCYLISKLLSLTALVRDAGRCRPEVQQSTQKIAGDSKPSVGLFFPMRESGDFEDQQLEVECASRSCTLDGISASNVNLKTNQHFPPRSILSVQLQHTVTQQRQDVWNANKWMSTCIARTKLLLLVRITIPAWTSIIPAIPAWTSIIRCKGNHADITSLNLTLVQATIEWWKAIQYKIQYFILQGM